nr:unnamed protein product [Callosobruchus analis]CAI5868535.1 unnamed protein product [Callosobruchus analis]
MPQPTEEIFKTISRKFRSLWDFPNCIGAIDGKHVRIKAPKNSGSTFFNYKEFYSVVMLALVDADNKFVAVDIGSYGREGDAGKCITRNGIFNPLPGMNILVPHVILGDEAFALHEHLMKPYPRNQSVTDKTKAIYNYRLSRARRTTENSFGILCAFFRIFFQPIATHPETTDKLIMCACILYNLLREANILPTSTNNTEKYPLPTLNLLPLSQNNVRGANTAIQTRETFKTYFNGPGAVAWQEHQYREN